MTTFLIIAAAAWLVFSIAVGSVIGCAISRADREQSAAREAAKLRHPSGRAR